jgi:8-oxo-dGTP pyrophosphatase MutT (NUDIX family)
MAKPRVVRAFSAGGVIFRVRPDAEVRPAATRRQGKDKDKDMTPVSRDDIEIAAVGYPREGTWILPKGTPAAGETVEQTAIREVREETGLEPRVVCELGSIDYWFARRSVRFHKEVFHYLMEAVGGDVAHHDHEYDEARWFPLPEALTRLTYVNEVEMVRRAEPLILEYVGEGALKEREREESSK